MRRRRQHGLGEDALDGRVRALARRAAGAIGDRDEIRLQAAQAARSPPTAPAPCPRFWAERTRTRRGCRAARRSHEAARAVALITPPRALPARRARCADRARARARPRSCLPARAARFCCRTRSRPAASSHCVTVSAAKPSRRWACSSRRNSRSCGAKSTTSSRPPGRSTRAASRIARALSSRKCST